jgi:hypothetical protein
MTLNSSAFSGLSCRVLSKLPSELVGTALVAETLGLGAFGFGSLAGTWLTEFVGDAEGGSA